MTKFVSIFINICSVLIHIDLAQVQRDVTSFRVRRHRGPAWRRPAVSLQAQCVARVTKTAVTRRLAECRTPTRDEKTTTTSHLTTTTTTTEIITELLCARRRVVVTRSPAGCSLDEFTIYILIINVLPIFYAQACVKDKRNNNNNNNNNNIICNLF